ncbi:MAG: response regulator transcription factor [Bacteroidales bacterium]|nr:response regulator transcription factor [Bacteroidales bacterium]
MNILIIEDELHNQRMLEGMVLKIRPHWNITGATESVADSVEWLKKNQPDLIFMDIQLTDGICFSIFEQVKVDCPVIFTTAYDNYAIQAFKVNSIDYLLKPVKENELANAITKFEQVSGYKIKTREAFDYREILNAIRYGEKKYRKRFLIQGASSYYRLNAEEIAYFHCKSKITFAVTFAGKEHIVDFTLESLEEELNPDEFFRANRHTILHINVVQKIEDYFGGKLHVRLIPPFKQEVIVSRLKNTAFKDWLGR